MSVETDISLKVEALHIQALKGNTFNGLLTIL